MDVVASLSEGRTAAAQCGLFTYKSVPVIFEPPCTISEDVIRERLVKYVARQRAFVKRQKFTFTSMLQGISQPLV